MLMDGRGGGNPMHEALMRLAQRKRQQTPWDHIPSVPGEVRGSDYRGTPEEYAQPSPPVMPGPPPEAAQPAEEAGWFVPGRPHPGMPPRMPLPVPDDSLNKWTPMPGPIGHKPDKSGRTQPGGGVSEEITQEENWRRRLGSMQEGYGWGGRRPGQSREDWLGGFQGPDGQPAFKTRSSGGPGGGPDDILNLLMLLMGGRG